MKLIIQGTEHEFVSEPTPKELHAIYVESTAPPIVKELYKGELEHLYKANGWQFAGALITDQELSPHQIVTRLHEQPQQVIAGLGRHALIGPVQQSIMSEHSGRHGAMLWVQAAANYAVITGESAIH